MEEHQQRVVDEKNELDYKRASLARFIDISPTFGTLPADERHRLRQQDVIMKQYSDILQERISAFPKHE